MAAKNATATSDLNSTSSLKSALFRNYFCLFLCMCLVFDFIVCAPDFLLLCVFDCQLWPYYQLIGLLSWTKDLNLLPSTGTKTNSTQPIRNRITPTVLHELSLNCIPTASNGTVWWSLHAWNSSNCPCSLYLFIIVFRSACICIEHSYDCVKPFFFSLFTYIHTLLVPNGLFRIKR